MKVRASSADRWWLLAPLVLVGGAVVFNLVSLAAERLPVSAANDGPQHQLMIRWARDRIVDGHLPFDGWYSYLGFGSPHFRHYQSLPHIVAGAFATVFGSPRVYQWSLYLVLATWPVCVYWSGRIVRASRWTCAIAALICLLVVSDPTNRVGFEFGAYTRGGYGVWSQLFGMWLLPLALALTWRAVNERGSFVLPALALAALVASHFLTGYLAVLVIGTWVLVSPRGFVRRAARTAVVLAGAFVVGIWAILPPLADAKWSSRQEWLLNSFYTDSYGPNRVLGWLVRGEIFDAGRRPLITLLAAVGVAACIKHWDDLRARALLLFAGLSLVLYMGRSVVGPVLDLLPVGEDILLHRYIIGVHLAGVFLAGVGGAWLSSVAVGALAGLVADPPRKRPGAMITKREYAAACVLAVGVVALMPAWTERWRFNASSAQAIAAQRITDATDGQDVGALIEVAKQRGDGRLYAGVSERSGEAYTVGGAQVYRIIADHAADGVGYTERTLSIPSNVERLFDETKPANYELFNVRYVLRVGEGDIPVPHEAVATRGRHTLWKLETSGYLDVVDTSGSITTTRTTLGRDMMTFLQSEAASDRVYPTVAYEGEPAAPATISGERPRSKPGRVTDQFARVRDGVFGGEIDARRPSVVLLKASFDPRWQITVDGKRVAPQMIAPGFVGAPVQAGSHTVRFVYSPLPWYWALFAIALLGALALRFLPRSVPWLGSNGSADAQGRHSDAAAGHAPTGR